MPDLPSNPDENSSHSISKLPSKRVFFGIAIGVIVIASIFGIDSWQASQKLKADILNIEQFIQDDNFSAAQTALTAAQVRDEFNPALLDLERQVERMKKSKNSFEQGNISFLEGDYASAISEFKKVVEKDLIRFAQAQVKLKEAQIAFEKQTIQEALALKSQKRFIEAVAVLNRSSANITPGTEFKELKDALTPLALAETKRANESQLAVYRSALNKMRIETDKFNGTKFYTDRSTPNYVNSSTFHLYIGKSEGGNPYLRFKVRYSDDDWLFVESASINIDGNVRDLGLGVNWDRDNAKGDIWEWVDVEATQSQLNVIRDVIGSKSSVIRFFGDKYRDDRTISSTQKRALQNVLDAYEALKRL